MLADDMKTYKIAEKCPFFIFVAVARIGIEVWIKVVLIPLDDFVVRAKLFPTGNTLLGQFRFFAPPEPAIVNRLWDHDEPPRKVRREISGTASA